MTMTARHVSTGFQRDLPLFFLHLCAPIVTALIFSPVFNFCGVDKNCAMTETRANLRGQKILDEPQEE